MGLYKTSKQNWKEKMYSLFPFHKTCWWHQLWKHQCQHIQGVQIRVVCCRSRGIAVEQEGYCCLFELDGGDKLWHYSAALEPAWWGKEYRSGKRGQRIWRLLLLPIGLGIWDANRLEQRTVEFVLLRGGGSKGRLSCAGCRSAAAMLPLCILFEG